MTQTIATHSTTSDSGMSLLLDKLGDLLVAETQFVKAGKFKESAELQADKMQLITQFQETIEKVEENERDPLTETLKRFHALLEDNLKALELAKDVSGKIIQKVSDSVNGPRKTNAYGANGQRPATPGSVQRGIAVDKGY